MNTLYIIIPAYNEEENIQNLIDDWYPVVSNHNSEDKSRLVVISDGSKDRTYDLLCDLSKTHKLLVPITKENEGHGPTLLYGYNYAINNGADFIFQTDSDRQTNPKEFERFWILREKYDAIIGSRPDRQDGKIRLFVERVLLFLLWVVFGIKIPDSNAPFRLMRSELVKKYLYRLPDKYNLPNVMLTAFFAYYKENIKFVRVSFKPRQGGKNSINIRKIIKIGLIGFFDFVKIRFDMIKYHKNIEV